MGSERDHARSRKPPRRLGTSTAAAAKCISARTAFVDAVVPALSGRLNETSRTARATTVQIVRARLVRASSIARSPQPNREAIKLAPTTKSTPTLCGEPFPNRTIRWRPRMGTATIHTATAATTAPPTLRARVRPWLAVARVVYSLVAVLAMTGLLLLGWLGLPLGSEAATR